MINIYVSAENKFYNHYFNCGENCDSLLVNVEHRDTEVFYSYLSGLGTHSLMSGHHGLLQFLLL